MKWEKKGLIYKPEGKQYWDKSYGILPTPYFLKRENLIRIFFSSTDENNFGRVSFIDVNAENPSEIVYSKGTPVLDIGNPGTFDDCGVVPSSVINYNGSYYMYYVGFQRTGRMPYMLFSGLAISSNNSPFSRVSEAPIIDRSSSYFLSMAAPYVIFEDNIFKMWLWIGQQWLKVNEKPYIKATIGYAESTNGLDWNIIKDDCIKPDEDNQFSVGRPWVVKYNNNYQMYYSVRYINKLYRIGFAESEDGINWNRKDNQIGIDVSNTGWDSEMICYPAVLKIKEKTYLFYNGNNNGETGFGYAELIKE